MAAGESKKDRGVQWFRKDAGAVLEELDAREHGLSHEESDRRLRRYGPNRLPEAKQPGLAVLFLRQFESPLIYILLISSIIVYLLEEPIDASIILSVLLVNAFIGMIQEGKARNTLEALKSFAKTEATVLREGQELVVDDSDLVPGDIIVLREGDKISADARVIASNSFSVDESALTGESTAVSKTPDALAGPDLQTADQKNMVFRGTFVVSGTAKAVVVETGLNTIIGGISKKLVSLDADVPLKRNIAALSRLISGVVVGMSLLVFLLGVFQGQSLFEMFFTAVAVAVSLIPEGLPVVITLVLATGVYRMSKENALVKRLQAVEALGRAKVIAVDKTGTITKNELMLTKVYVDGRTFDITGSGYEPLGEARLDGGVVSPGNHPELLLSAKIATFCADATVSYLEKEKIWKVIGDPTEAALLVFGAKVGFRKEELEREEPHLFEIPFDSRHKYHATIHDTDKRLFLTVVGAPEVLLDASNFYWSDGRIHKMTDEARRSFHEKILQLSQSGMRVVGFAVNEDTPSIDITVDTMPTLAMVGLFGMRDVMREGVRGAVKKAHENGIRVVMITGDHRETAQALAADAGIFRTGDKVIVGPEIDQKSLEELADDTVSVYARVTPEHKLRIIEAYKKRGDIIAMTGDGVNDALSLVAADLGIAMGKMGTEVTKEAADIVLLDDNFKSIVSAIEEGRNIYKTIKHVILYLFSTGMGELGVVVIALFFMLPLPLLPSQILWLNLVTDGVLVLSLALEPRQRITKRPEDSSKYFVDSLMLRRILLMGFVMTAGTLLMFLQYYQTDIMKAWTVSLTTLAVFQWFNVFNCRSSEKSVFSMNPFSNKSLVLAFAVTVAFHLLAVYAPFMQKVLRTTSLSLAEWGYILAVSSLVIIAEELRKLASRAKARRIGDML